MKCAVESICCQLRTLAEAAEGKQQHYSGQIFRTFTSKNLHEIFCATRDVYEALSSAIALAEEKERAVREAESSRPRSMLWALDYVPPEDCD
jgi:hypothetical protein